MIGKSRSHVANTLRLLKLPDPVKAYIHAGKLSAPATPACWSAIPMPTSLPNEIVARGLNVRQVEAMAREAVKQSGKEQTNGAKRASARRKMPIRWRWKNA